ncbi:hypothetical protein TIFTF001_031850 [Ficus carica]|uniref:Uncharacterized protein n=1 Tax=Ficus carica TaxID=3494 RepID=A0AA88E257_FICCA|nr:hypothetical protein TIFTF001_031850 [Ficus carica]
MSFFLPPDGDRIAPIILKTLVFVCAQVFPVGLRPQTTTMYTGALEFQSVTIHGQSQS